MNWNSPIDKNPQLGISKLKYKLGIKANTIYS